MMRRTIAALAALAVPLAISAGEGKQATEQSSETREARSTSSGGETDPTYGGYSTDPGTEARSDAKQASDPGREKSTAKQDEQGGAPSSASGARGSIANQPPAVTDMSRRSEERMDGTDSGSEETDGRSSSGEGAAAGEKSTAER